MADAPKPITSPPALPWQPWDATAEGNSDAQTDATTIYDAAGSTSGSEPWVKIRDGGAADSSGRSQPGAWPADGTSDGSAWKQT